MSDVQSDRQLSLELWAKAFLIRETEQRLLQLFSEGKLFGTVHTCIGQEWTGVAIADALMPGDLMFSNHRCHGHYLARTGDVDGLIAEIMGRANGMCGGRGGSQHICRQGFFSNGIQGGIVPVAAGLGFAEKLNDTQHISVVFIGDGTLGEGAVYETMNLASKWELPLLIVLENNLYAQSTNQEETLAGEILDRPRAFGIEAAHAPLWDTAALMERARSAVDHVRSKRKPFFLCVDTYRLMAHSKGDDDRDPAEVDSYRKRDPLTLYIEANPVDAARLQERAAEQVDAAVARADASAYTQAGSSDADDPGHAEVSWKAAPAAVSERVVSRIHDALQLNMLRNDKIVLIGEDIEGPYGGAFKVTRDLSLEFPGRVRNTPISESAIVGLGNGLALAGYIPVCEIMFGDFITLALDQLINHASKFRYMYNDQVSVPLVVRTPMGGKRGYGPTHSQSLEKHLLGIPDVQVLALNHRFDPFELYDNLLSNVKQPTLVIENKLLYGMRIDTKLPEGFVLERSAETFPTVRITTGQTPDLTLYCYGGMLPDAERAVDQLFEEHEMIVEILCPSRIYPLNAAPLEASLANSGRLLLVEEGIGFAGFGAEVLAQLTERSTVNFRAKRLAAPAHPIPSCGPLEKELLPGVRQIVDAAVELVGHG